MSYDPRNPNGFIVTDKPAGLSSFGVVSRIRRILSQQANKKIKVGHTGTLDPFATGLMIIVVGEHCKRASEFSKLNKTYEATIVLGKTSTTGDPEGDITALVDQPKPTRVQLKAALQRFTGVITQTPPVYSAIKINGQRAYALARQGKTVNMPSREVTVYNIELLRYDYPELVIRTKVSSGTYIRTLAEDIGRVLGTGAYTKSLRRIAVDVWTIEEADSIEGPFTLYQKGLPE